MIEITFMIKEKLNIFLSTFTLLYTDPLNTFLNREAQWPSGRASVIGARGRGSILTKVAVLYP